MKICVRKIDNIVAFVGNDIELTDDAIETNNVICYDYNNENAEIIDIKDTPLPQDFLCDCYTYINGVFALTPDGQSKIDAQAIQVQAKAKAIAIAANQTKAQQLLDDTDLTIIRCAESGIAVPEVWRAYRADLRAIRAEAVNVLDFPVMPEYPEGS